jgi:flagellar hook-associated protein 2
MGSTVDGIVSGINTAELIAKLVDVARAPIKQLESKQSSLSIRRFAFQDLNTLLGSLQSKLEAVDTESEFGAYTATSTIPSGVTATITGAATPGTHDLSVTNLAQSELLQSSGFATATAALSGTSVALRVGPSSNPVTTSVDIDAALGTTTLQGLATYLTDNVAGVNAWVMNTGAASDPYVLMIEGSDTGTDNEVSVNVNNVTGLSFTNPRDAEDAAFTIDGVDIISGSNSVTDVLPGVTLNLLNESFGTAKLAVNRDSGAMSSKVQGIVDSYNALDSWFDAQTGTAAGAILSGDSTVRQVQQKVASTISQDYENGALSGLNSLGLSTDKTGKMVYASATFTSALGTNYSDVIDTLTGTDGLFGKLQSELDVITDTTTGSVQARITSIDSQVSDLTDRIADAETRLETYTDMIRNQFTNMELILGRYQGTQKYLEQQIAQWTKQK